MRGWRGALAAGLLLPAVWAAGPVTVPGSFLYRSSGGTGGIVVVDGGGINYYQIVPAGDAGFNTTGFNSGSIVQEFSQSRNGTRIVFTSAHWGYLENDIQTTALPSQRVFIMNGDGTGVKQLTYHNPNATNSESDFSPQVSPDGTKVVYVGGETIAPPGSISGNGTDCSGQETQAFWVMNSDGTNPHVVRNTNWGADSFCNAGGAVEAAWSPDGTKLLVRDTFGSCYGNHEIGIMNADGSNFQSLSCIPANGAPTLGLDWSPDGTKVVALVGGSASSDYQIWDVSSGTPVPTASLGNSLPNSATNDSDMVRFSPDSTMVAIADSNNGGSIFIYDLNFNLLATVSTLGHENMSGGFDAFWWSPGVPGAPSTMTLGVSSVYINACANYTVQLQPSTYNASGTLLTHGYGGSNVNISSGDGDSWYLDAFGFIQFNPTRSSATGTLQLTNFGATSNSVPLTTDSVCNCQSAGGNGLAVKRGGMRYNFGSENQIVQTLTVTNSTGSSVAGPINIVISNLSAPVTLSNLSGTSGCASSGSPYVTALASGSLAAGASVSVSLLFRDPLLTGFTYSTTVTTGFGAP